MTVTNYSQWSAAGKPWQAANPCLALANTCETHGVGYGIIGDQSHLTASTPEDHCPYSHTPWPGTQPYDFVNAVDLSTTDPAVARRIIAAKRSGRLPCLKYINWTDENGSCWHTSWEPNEATVPSTDRGHIHCSVRTDHTSCNHADGFDPFVAEEDDVALTKEEHDRLVNIDEAAGKMLAMTTPAALTVGNQKNELGAFLHQIFDKISTPAPVSITDAQITAMATEIAGVLTPYFTELTATMTTLVDRLAAAGEALQPPA